MFMGILLVLAFTRKFHRELSRVDDKVVLHKVWLIWGVLHQNERIKYIVQKYTFLRSEVMQLAVRDSKIGVSLYFLANLNSIHSQRFRFPDVLFKACLSASNVPVYDTHNVIVRQYIRLVIRAIQSTLCKAEASKKVFLVWMIKRFNYYAEYLFSGFIVNLPL